MVTHIPSTVWSSAKHYLIKQYPRPTGPVADEVFDHVLQEFGHSGPVFVHIGLRDIKSAFGPNPYEFVRDKLASYFSSILVPGFTKSFRETGSFHERKSIPELGAFSRLFFEEMDYRTEDPLHSILVKGDYRFDGCNFEDTFGPDGCYAKLNDDNVLYLNIGTPWLVSTQLHFIESVMNVPYVKTVAVNGTAYFETRGEVSVTQKNYHKNNWLYFWNRQKIRDDMITEGSLDHYTLNGLNIFAVRAREMYHGLAPKIEKDPYYLVR